MTIHNAGIRNILKGILQYSSGLKGELVPYFREILDKPSPKSILISCVDSRIVASRLLQAEPGNYFLIRNPGNFIPKYECDDTSVPGCTAASIELACIHNKANTISVIGHSDCKTLNILFEMRDKVDSNQTSSASHLNKWLLLNGKESIKKFKEFEKNGFKDKLTFTSVNSTTFDAYIDPENTFNVKDKFSQINTLEQLKNVNNYNFIQGKMQQNILKGYALWLDIFKSDVHLFSYNQKRFVKIDENTYEELYKECSVSQQT